MAKRDPEADGPMTSGMVALVPSAADTAKLAVDDGEDPGQMHLTLAYLGDNATGLPAHSQQALHDSMADLAAHTPPVTARAAGHLLFNPDGGPDGDRTPCAAYLVSDSPDLTPLHHATAAAASALDPGLNQFDPFIPHVTGAYDRDAGALTYAGPVTFDRMRVAIGDQHTDYPLTGNADETDEAADDAADLDPNPEGGDLPGPETSADEQDAGRQDNPEGGDEKKDMTSIISPEEWEAAFADAEVKADAPATNAMPDGSYQINHPGQLKAAVNALTSGAVSAGKRGALRKHVIHHAARLKAANMVPQSVRDEDDDKKGGDGKSTKDADTDTLETKKVVASAAGVKRYGKPIGTQLGTPRDANAAQAQKNGDAVNAYKDLLAGKTGTVEPLNTMDTASLEDLTRVAYSYKSSDPKVVAIRTQLANELARRGMSATHYGALGVGNGKSGKHGKHRRAGTQKNGLPVGVRAPRQEAKSADPDEPDSAEYKAKYTAAQCAEMAKKGHALPDGSYPIADKTDLKSAIGLRNHGKSYTKATVHKHIVKRAKALDATDMLPEDMDTESKALSWDGTVDAFTAGVLLGMAGMDEAAGLECKAGPPGHTFASPDPNAKRLRDYWVHGKGALKIKWGVPHDFDRCVVELTKYVGARAKGLCNIYHRSALGVAPGQEGKVGKVAKKVAAMAGSKSLVDPSELELKSGNQLWVRDPGAVDGWRAHEPAWEADRTLIEEWKAMQPPKNPDDDTDTTEDAQPNTDQGAGDDDGVLSALDSYAAMVPQVSPEDAYEKAIGDDVPWNLRSDGTLVDDRPQEQLGVQSLFGEDTPDEEGDDPDSIAEENNPDGAPQADEGGMSEDGPTGQDDDESDGSGENDAIPAVAELLAALMADEDDDAAANDDGDNGQAEEDTAESKALTPAGK